MNHFYPSRRAVLAVALGIPVSLLAGLAVPSFWAAGAVWSALAILLVLTDMMLGASRRRLTVVSHLPGDGGVGRREAAEFSIHFDGRAPDAVEAELEGNSRLAIEPPRLQISGPENIARFVLDPLRRGEGRLERLWLRWTGPLGLAWIQTAYPLDRTIRILPDIQMVREEAMRLFRRDTDTGLHTQLDRGAGSEFHALREFQRGHDPRQIDWKRSARRNALIVKEFRIEQNQHIVAVLDTGRLMSQPLLGQPRIDRALHAILLLAYVALKLGDRVGLFAFDSKARLSSGTVSGVNAFAALQRQAAGLDYSAEETNFTLGLTQLAGELERRSTIVIFSDFSDTTSAELMLENIAPLLRRHTVMFVVFRDEELEHLQQDEPGSAADATRSVIADMMMKERDIVLRRLRHMGVNVVDVPVMRMNAGVIESYLAMKQRIRLQP